MKLPIAVVLLCAALPAFAQQGKHCVVDLRGNQVCGVRANQCILDRYRAAWCAPAEGTATKDRYDEVVCGAGACVKNVYGEIVCAGEPGGAISTEPSGKMSCGGGCVPASRTACQRMTQD